jgi:DNA-binding transcriptional regulator/RsmH inhibitor MraZ
VPLSLRERAGISREAVVVGVLNHGEIWDPEKWDARDSEVDEGRFAELAEGLDF